MSLSMVALGGTRALPNLGSALELPSATRLTKPLGAASTHSRAIAPLWAAMASFERACATGLACSHSDGPS